MGAPSVSVTVYRNPVASAPWYDNGAVEAFKWSLRKKDGTAYAGFLQYNSYRTFQTGSDLTPADLIYLQASLSGVDKSLVHCGHRGQLSGNDKGCDGRETDQRSGGPRRIESTQA